jgi:branched-chain amino acid transport system substrate-binding protein
MIRQKISLWLRAPLLALALVAVAAFGAAATAQAADPIKIGFSVSLTGGLASSGKAHLLSQQIWAEEINAKGGLLGRQVQLVYYDDQTNASLVPMIYAKLIDIDKVDLLMGAATNLIVGAMQEIMQHNKMVIVLLALGSNADQGESHPQELIPKLVDYLMQGKMPVEQMMTMYPLAEINRAAQESAAGTTIKPVLRMPG